MLKPLSIGLASLSASLVLGTSANGMVLVQTQSVDVATIPEFTFDKFNAALGELLNVVLDYDLEGTDNAFDPAGLCTVFEDCDGNFQVSIGGSVAYSPLDDSVSTFISNEEVDAGITEILSLTGTQTYAPTSSFVGDGSSSVPGLVSVFAQCVVVERPGCFGHETSLTGTVSLTYEYQDHTPVPESSSLLAIAVITAMGVGHRLVNK